MVKKPPGTHKPAAQTRAASAAPQLSEKQCKHLRGLAHELKPVIRVGSAGLGSTRGYTFTYATRTGRSSTGQLQIVRIDEESGTQLGGASSNILLQASQSYRLVFTGLGGQFTGQLFALPDLITPVATITGADPPVGLTGDYHLTTASGVVDRGVRCSNTAFPTPLTALGPCTAGGIQAPTLSVALGGQGDYDGQYRPQLRTLRVLTPWDLGADELPGVPVPLLNALAARTLPRSPTPPSPPIAPGPRIG